MTLCVVIQVNSNEVIELAGIVDGPRGVHTFRAFTIIPLTIQARIIQFAFLQQ